MKNGKAVTLSVLTYLASFSVLLGGLGFLWFILGFVFGILAPCYSGYVAPSVIVFIIWGLLGLGVLAAAIIFPHRLARTVYRKTAGTECEEAPSNKPGESGGR